MIIKLNQQETDLLQSITLYDDELEKVTKFALYNRKHYEINLPDELADDFLDALAAESNHEEDNKRQNQIDKLIDKIEEQVERHRSEREGNGKQ